MENKLSDLGVYSAIEEENTNVLDIADVQENKNEYGDLLTGFVKQEAKNKIRSIKSINQSGDEWIITDELPGVHFQGIQYYDLKNIQFINNTGMAKLIDLLKSLLGKGVEVKFVNVNEKIKNKIKSLGLDPILNCV